MLNDDRYIVISEFRLCSRVLYNIFCFYFHAEIQIIRADRRGYPGC